MSDRENGNRSAPMSGLLGDTGAPAARKTGAGSGESLLGATGSGSGRLFKGQRLASQFRLVKEIGRGAMGVVWEARDEYMDSRVALKLINPDLLREPEMVHRFREEVRVAQKLADPHIVRVHSLHAAEGIEFMSMEYLEGATLAEVIAAQRRRKRLFSVAWSLRVVSSILAGLEYAHNEYVIHRDIKPSNVMLAGIDLDEEPGLTAPPVKILDFGIAELGRRAGLRDGAGTPIYIAPEVFSGRDFDHRADLYAVGVVLYELLAGFPPHGIPTPLSTLRRDCTLQLDNVVNQALVAEPQGRWPTAMAFLNSLDPTRLRVQMTAMPASQPGAANTGEASASQDLPDWALMEHDGGLERFAPGAERHRRRGDLGRLDPVLGRILGDIEDPD